MCIAQSVSEVGGAGRAGTEHLGSILGHTGFRLGSDQGVTALDVRRFLMWRKNAVIKVSQCYSCAMNAR